MRWYAVIAVVVNRIQCLQRGADIVEVNLLGVNERPDVWIWYFSIWARAEAPYFSASLWPKSDRHRPITAALGRCRWKKIGSKLVDVIPRLK